MAPADSIPVLHRKLQQIVETEDLIEGGHFYKEVVQLFNSFPLDELFASSTEAIGESIVELVHLQENQQIRLFVRRDLLHRNVSLLVVMPRDRFNATHRKTLQARFLERFGGKSIDYRAMQSLQQQIVSKGTILDKDGQPLQLNVLGAYSPEVKRVVYSKSDANGKFFVNLPDFKGARTIQYLGYSVEVENFDVVAPDEYSFAAIEDDVVYNEEVLTYLELSRKRKKIYQYGAVY